jgi:hypothetical protein
MLTLSNTIVPSNSTAALFRAWSKFVRDGMVAGGWVQTSDTGQIDFATASAPGAANTKAGYVILRMNDSLQTAHPVFVRLDFGSAGATNNVSIWITAGSGSNGSGTITGAWVTDQRLGNGSSDAVSQPYYSHVSATSASAAVALFYHAVNTFLVHFSIERAKNADGTDDGTGLLVYSTGRAGVKGSDNRLSIYSTVDDGTLHQAEGAAYVFANNQQESRSDVGIGIPIPHRYNADGFEIAQGPGLNYVLLNVNSWNFGAIVGVYMYGQRHEYIRLGGTAVAHVRGASPTDFYVAIRYE